MKKAVEWIYNHCEQLTVFLTLPVMWASSASAFEWVVYFMLCAILAGITKLRLFLMEKNVVDKAERAAAEMRANLERPKNNLDTEKKNSDGC